VRTKQEHSEDIRRGRRAALVVNTRSRRGRLLYEESRRRLEAAGFELLGAYALEQSGDLESLIAEALGKGPDLLIAGGGDGTISTAGRMLAHQDVALGLLPLGTTNNFARTVRIAPDLDAAIATLVDGKVIDVDLGLAGGVPFTNHVGIGLSAQVMISAPRRLKRTMGRLAYPMTALGLLAGHRPLRATIRAEGRELSFQTHQVYVANGGFHAGRPITADAHADDRLLVAYPVGGNSRRELLRETARNASTGHRRTLRQRPFLAVRELSLETDRPIPVEVDGEPRGTTPLRIAIDGNALRIMAPADSPDL
jgi:diacylglycerol kinase (ATP)